MGWRGVELNLTTSLVASVVLGLAVDNSVQFIARFRRAQVGTADMREAILERQRPSAPRIITRECRAGRHVRDLLLLEFQTDSLFFGLPLVVTIIGCLIEDLVLLPARLTSPVFRAK